MGTRDAGKEKKNAFLTNIELNAENARWLEIYLVNLRFDTENVSMTTKRNLFNWLIEQFSKNNGMQDDFRESIEQKKSDDPPLS